MTETPAQISYDKLVRDKIPEIIKNSNRRPEYRTLDRDDDFLKYLIKKLHEEVLEFLEDPSVEELADVREVVEAFSSIRAFADVESVQKKKRKDRGGFEKRILLTGVFEEDMK